MRIWKAYEINLWNCRHVYRKKLSDSFLELILLSTGYFSQYHDLTLVNFGYHDYRGKIVITYDRISLNLKRDFNIELEQSPFLVYCNRYGCNFYILRPVIVPNGL